MRIKIIFQNTESIALPVNYNYFLASAIYNYLKQSDPDYAEFLHDEGYVLEKKKFKLFTFSQLRAKKRKVVGAKIIFQSSVVWNVSSPSEEFLGGFAAGLLSRGKLTLAGVEFKLKDVLIPELPRFSDRMHFTCLSPITISTVIGDAGERKLHYCSPEESDFVEKIRQNLIRKYSLLHEREPGDDTFHMEFDREYVQKRDKISKLINFKGVDIRGYMAPFYAEGNPALIKVGYECGFGDKNSAGFGMVEVIRKRREHHAT